VPDTCGEASCILDGRPAGEGPVTDGPLAVDGEPPLTIDELRLAGAKGSN
jgi:hypothetical protein